MPKKLDFDKLFLFKHKLDIVKGGKPIGSVYQRLLNDSDIEYARSQALRASGEFRQSLRDTTSTNYYSYIVPLYDLGQDELVANILVQELGPRRERLQSDIPPIIPRKPEPGSSLETLEDYQKEVDEAETNWYKKVNEQLEKELTKRKEELNTKEPEDLRSTLRQALTNKVCSLRMINVFQTYCAYMGTYNDAACIEKYFETYEEFADLPSEVLNQLVDGYFSLGLETSEIKK